MLTKRRYRITAPRRAVIAFLSQTRGMHTIQGIQEKLPDVHITSVYRIMEILEKEGCVIKILSPESATAQYELADSHHHHVVCLTCGFTEHTPCENRVKIPKTFSAVTRHEVTAYGTCRDCAK